nr:integrase, catalytic region, zinc finger, CCHC-type, peptidase aspartic, catalytic [Tanacetum cinerariifolium]GEZ62618.1 integrase, catalytic region, zinc finger, CCHC-type, peptidase aspartic, catalytic [Tanacetum cinerariifolium]
FVIPVFSPGDDLIACLSKAMTFLTAIASLRGYKGKLILVLHIMAMLLVQREILQVDRQEMLNATTIKEKAMLAEAQEAGQILDEEQLAFLVDLRITVAVLMANISNYASNVISEEKANKDQNNESITVELERYKERVKTFVQRLNIDLSCREKMIDSQMDDMIKEKLALKEKVDSLEQNLSKQIKEKECLLETFNVFQNKFKEKEIKYMETKIDLEKKIKELNNIVSKVGQSAQTVHMLTKPQSFYDNVHKQVLGYQNLFYLKKPQRIKPTLYDGIVIFEKHVAMPVIDDEEILILEEESRLKMFVKAKDPEVTAKKISNKPINYEKLNRLIDDFGKLRVEVPSELPKVSLVNENLKKLKFQLAQFDSVVKKRTTPNDLTKDLLNEITEVKTVFDQMEAAVHQSSRSKSCEKCLNLDAEFSKSKQEYNDLLKKYSQLEKHCISLEMSMQLKQEVFQNDESCVYQNAPEIPEYFENNDLKAHMKDKDMTICKLKDTIKSLRNNNKEEIVDHYRCDLATINEELENSVAKLISKNESLYKEINHVKQVVQIVLYYLDSECSKHMTGNRSQLMNFVSKFLGTVSFKNDQIARIMGYGDYQLENVIILRVYCVKGLGYNLFSVGQFVDADLEAAF